ncbi:MAG: class I SAM-dependent methyltransferase [Bacteroidales bacterium]|nr:class I SAM-dependent methyltransferase [Bacteroidales bacterium]
MKINTNLWNKIRYTIYTPVYDSVAKHFYHSRKLSIENLNIQKGERVLIVGAGTGLDLEFLPQDCEVVATDITPSMVERIKLRNKEYQLNLETMVMDGQRLRFPDASFDKVILHLILAVIPDPVSCIKEVERVLKPGGEIAVFDKLVRKGRKLSYKRKLLNLLTNFLFSDITRDIYHIVGTTDLIVLSDEEANLNGNFRRLKLKK